MRSVAVTIVLAAAAMMAVPQVSSVSARTATARNGAAAAFPYLGWPAAVAPKDAPVEQPVGHFRFWDGSALQDVEGHTYIATLAARDGARSFDGSALRQGWERTLTRMGGSRIASGQVPASVIATINDADKKSLAPGLGDIGKNPVETWTVRRPHRQIWVQFTNGADQTSLAVVEAKLN